ncbi:MAG: tetrahydrofolate dehydrogenase/cyclohydrolase catalytic domain-containing protein [bacterium]
MKIPCEDISSTLKKYIISRVKKLKKRKIEARLVTVLVGKSKDQLSFVAAKKKIGNSLGIDFNFIQFKEIPQFMKFAKRIKTISENKENTAVIIQQPLPSRLYTDTLYDFVPNEKEIEAHKNKSPFLQPIGQAVLTVLKYAFIQKRITKSLIIDEEKDILTFKQALKHKKVVLMGRGPTGGYPIGEVLTKFKINYININSDTPNPEQYLSEADVIITAAGKKVISPENLKQGVVLINVGLRREKGKLKGDYDENEIKNIASLYTATPKGLGPIDILYLYKNLIEAAELQNK